MSQKTTFCRIFWFYPRLFCCYSMHKFLSNKKSCLYLLSDTSLMQTGDSYDLSHSTNNESGKSSSTSVQAESKSFKQSQHFKANAK